MRIKVLSLAVVLLALAVFTAGCPKAPPVPEKPSGPETAMRNAMVICSTRTVGANADVAYQFDWGDGTLSEWSDFRPGGEYHADSHSFIRDGIFSIRARAKTDRSGASDWSEPLVINVEALEGEVSFRFGFHEPEFPEDSADFSLNTFALGPDGRSYIGCEWALLFRQPGGRRDREFLTEDYDGFFPAPSLGDDGRLYITAENETLYAFNSNGSRHWTHYIGDDVVATTAIGVDGAVFVQTVYDSLYAINPDGSRRWSFLSYGYSSPVVGVDGTVYACNDEGRIYAIDPLTGAELTHYTLSLSPINSSPALDPGRNRLYVGDEEGNFIALNLETFTADWQITIGFSPSSAVIGTDGTIYVGCEGFLIALDPADGSVVWDFEPPLLGVVSTPAVSDQGLIYAIVSMGKKRAALAGGARSAFGVDSLYAVNSDGSRRWAVGLAEGYWDELMSSPKIDADGFVYFGNGFSAWIVRGLGGPAPSPWPMFQRDGRNTGRAGN